jgi:hypothetical protein
MGMMGGGTGTAPAGPKLLPKNRFYDAFLSAEPTATVAMVAPRSLWRQPGVAVAAGSTLCGMESASAVEIAAHQQAMGLAAGGQLLQGGAAVGASSGKSSKLTTAASMPLSSAAAPATADAQRGNISQPPDAAVAGRAGAPAVSAAVNSPLLGGLFIVAGFKGQVLIYENT